MYVCVCVCVYVGEECMCVGEWLDFTESSYKCMGDTQIPMALFNLINMGSSR